MKPYPILHPGNYNKNSHILLLVMLYIFTSKSISQSQPTASYMIGYTTIYILIIPTQAALAYDKRKKKDIQYFSATFFVKMRDFT